MNRTLAMMMLVGCATGAPRTEPTTTAAPNQHAVELAARRAQMLGWLHDYTVAGAYPTDAFGRPASVFVDDQGVRCPMAELVHKSGRDDLVEAVHRESNAVRLADVHAGPLHDWMLSSGLTEDEIALVQGAANIDMRWMETQPMELQLAEGRAQVRGKLETAEMALRQNTAHGLDVALSRLPAKPDVLARSPVRGKVVPADAVAAAPPPPALPVLPTLVIQRSRQRGF
jgi:hypothetical protein